MPIDKKAEGSSINLNLVSMGLLLTVCDEEGAQKGEAIEVFTCSSCSRWKKDCEKRTLLVLTLRGISPFHSPNFEVRTNNTNPRKSSSVTEGIAISKVLFISSILSAMAATTTAQQNPENPMKTLDEPSDPNPAAEIVSPPDSAHGSPISPPSDGAREGIKAAGGDDSCQGNDIQKKMKRAERFGMPVHLTEEEKRNSRAERFGTGSPVQGSDALKKSEEHKRQARAQRFGIVKSDTTDEEAKKKKARLTRFAPPGKTDPVEEDKRKARALRFSQPQPGSQPQANGKGNIEQEAVAVDKAGGEPE